MEVRAHYPDMVQITSGGPDGDCCVFKQVEEGLMTQPPAITSAAYNAGSTHARADVVDGAPGSSTVHIILQQHTMLLLRPYTKQHGPQQSMSQPATSSACKEQAHLHLISHSNLNYKP